MNFASTSLYIYIYIYIIRDLVGNNKNSIVNCIIYLTKKEPEDGS